MEFKPRMLSLRQKIGWMVVVAAVLTGCGTAPAQADGVWTSKVTGGLLGSFVSRWWWDPQLNSTPTGVNFSHCQLGDRTIKIDSLRVTLFQKNGVLSPKNKGAVNNYCNSTYSNWQGQPRGDYRWGLTSARIYNGPARPNVTGYRVDIRSLATVY